MRLRFRDSEHRMYRVLGLLLLLAASPARALSVPGSLVRFQVATATSTVSAANAATTTTAPAPGAGLFNYIVGIQVYTTCTTAIAGTAKLEVTTANLPNALPWSFGNACAVGATNQVIDMMLPYPLKSSVANTATSITCPALGAAGLCRATLIYFTAP